MTEKFDFEGVLPHQPMRQWVLSVPFPLRFPFAGKPEVMIRVASKGTKQR